MSEGIVQCQLGRNLGVVSTHFISGPYNSLSRKENKKFLLSSVSVSLNSSLHRSKHFKIFNKFIKNFLMISARALQTDFNSPDWTPDVSR